MSQKRPDLLNKLLLRNARKGRLLSAWIALCTGCTLLLLSVMIWSAFRDLLNGKGSQDSLGSTFLTVSKQVSDASMADKNSTQISGADLEQIRKAPQVQDVGLLTPANFKVAASLGSGQMSFYTLLFLEAAPDRFMDQMPQTWKWEEGDQTIPIILSRDFLNMYNYIFAPSQGLPLLSEQSVKALGFTLTMGEGPGQMNYRAQVEGFSDRISSVLVPQSFIDYGNKRFAASGAAKVSRVIVKVGDPSNKEFVTFLEQHQYTTNSEQLRFSKMRSVVEVVSGATGALALLLIGIGALVFILFIELTMARAQAAVRLLLQIGYGPKTLSSYLVRKYIPIMLSALLVALLIAAILQFVAAQKLAAIQLQIAAVPGLFVWAAAGLSALVLGWQIRTAIRKALRS
ncbi:MAG: hypothetical protein JNL13_12070 [Chitinophagaceae bacterium]|nr:hypothetical protein [Chitinophagaceae bacterium]